MYSINIQFEFILKVMSNVIELKSFYNVIDIIS